MIANNNHEPSNNNITIYSPSSITATFNAALSTLAEKKILHIKGIFQKSGNALYSGFYYDKLKDETSDNSIALITSDLLHNQLQENITIEFNGFVTRRIDKSGRIDIQLNIVDLINQETNKYTEDDLKKIEIINAKRDKGFKDIDSLINKCVLNNTKANVAVIIGKSAIIDSDIKKELGEATSFFNLSFSRVSLSSPDEIISKIKFFDNASTDIICVARGGGENLEIFDKFAIAASAINCTPIIASAIGHADDVTLFEEVADKKFITPSAFGAYLKLTYNNIIEEQTKSKAKLVNDISTQLNTLHKKEVDTLKTQIQENDKLFAQLKPLVEQYKVSSEDLQIKLSAIQSKNTRNIIVISIIAIIIGLVIGLLL